MIILMKNKCLEIISKAMADTDKLRKKERFKDWFYTQDAKFLFAGIIMTMFMLIIITSIFNYL